MITKKGFTLVELVVVIALLAIVIAIAAPNIFKFSNNANRKALQAKIDAMAKTVELFVENNSNDIVYKCANGNSSCICESFTNNGSNYTCRLKVQKLVDLMLYTETCKKTSCNCVIINPIDDTKCLENEYFDISINLSNNTAKASFVK